MAKLRTDRVPASFGEHVWNNVTDVVEVADDDAHALLGIVDAEFHEVIDAPAAPKAKVTEPDPDAKPDE